MNLSLLSSIGGQHAQARISNPFWIACALLRVDPTREAEAANVGQSDSVNCTLSNTGRLLPEFPASSPVVGESGLRGTTDPTIPADGNGLFHFHCLFTSTNLNDSSPESAGYLPSGALHQPVDPDLQLEHVFVPVLPGQVIGFRIPAVTTPRGAGKARASAGVEYFVSPPVSPALSNKVALCAMPDASPMAKQAAQYGWMVAQYIGNYPRTQSANGNTDVIRRRPNHGQPWPNGFEDRPS